VIPDILTAEAVVNNVAAIDAEDGIGRPAE
jgi:hypothetical protein